MPYPPFYCQTSGRSASRAEASRSLFLRIEYRMCISSPLPPLVLSGRSCTHRTSRLGGLRLRRCFETGGGGLGGGGQLEPTLARVQTNKTATQLTVIIIPHTVHSVTLELLRLVASGHTDDFSAPVLTILGVLTSQYKDKL